MLEDRYGLPLTTTSQVARDAYIAGVDSVISGVAGYRDDLARAIEADRSLALAHAALARGLFMDGEVGPARASVKQARELAASASPREQGHVNAVCLPLEGKTLQAMQATLAHLRSWPRDAMVLAPAAGVFGLYGFSGHPDHEEQLYQLLSSLAPEYGQDWWFDAVYSFAACETGRLEQAWTLIERSLAQRPRHANAAHFRTHVMYERGDAAGSLAYLESWMPALDKRSLMHCHLSWHVALAALALGQRERAWEAYRAGVHPGGAWGPPINVVTDAASFLWRAELAGEPRSSAMWRQVHDHALQAFPKAGLAYADVHTLLACVADADASSLEHLLGEIRQRIADDRYPSGDVVVWICDGFAAYGAGDWNGAIRCLTHALPKTVRIGGSRAQRDLVELTLVAAFIKADRPGEARALIARRHGRGALVGVAGYD